LPAKTLTRDKGLLLTGPFFRKKQEKNKSLVRLVRDANVLAITDSAPF